MMVLLTAACGKKGPLLYPDMLMPAAPASVTARQSGDGIRISFALPAKDRAGRRLENLAGVKIFKRGLLTGQQACSACSEDFPLFKKLYLDFLETAQRSGSLLVLMDADVRPGGNYTYKITPFTTDDADGETSAPATANMVQPPLAPVLRILPAPTEIRLELVELPLINGQFVGYDLYRAPKGEVMPYLPLNPAPFTGNSYIDSRGLDRNTTYRYAARTVVRMPSGEIVESPLSNEVEGALKNEEE
jgi:hypothetical protein